MSAFIPVVIGKRGINVANITDVYYDAPMCSVEVRLAGNVQWCPILVGKEAEVFWEWWCEKAERIEVEG